MQSATSAQQQVSELRQELAALRRALAEQDPAAGSRRNGSAAVSLISEGGVGATNGRQVVGASDGGAVPGLPARLIIGLDGRPQEVTWPMVSPAGLTSCLWVTNQRSAVC